ncbi:MAG: WD40 repeat domain-containing serine/threonine protein kinase [Terriglobia bacterium]
MMPAQISSYRLEGEIARGGMGIVYRGVHTVFQEVVAIKAIYPELMLSEDLRERFLNEARIQRQLQHPNIVQIREFLAIEDRSYIVMELIQGETLAQCLRSLGRPMTPGEAGGILRQALEGLGYAHAQGVIHRDIKPSNIMLTHEGVAKLTDFGIARGLNTARLTQTGMAVGTAAYMSPEQIQGVKIDHRADIYSMGITLYEMLTGRLPFERPKDSDSDFPILTAHATQLPPSPRQFAPDLPLFLEAAILKALEKKPADRFQTCAEFQAAMAQEPIAVNGAGVGVPAKPATPVEPVRLPPMAPATHAPHTSSPLRHAFQTPQPRRWPLFVSVIALILAVAGAAGWRFLGTPGEYRLQQTLTGHSGEVTSVAFSSDGRLLASGSVDRTVKIWDVATRQLKQTLAGHQNFVVAVAFSPDGDLLASGSTDNTMKVWDVASGNLLQTLDGDAKGNSVLCVAFSPDGRLVAAGRWGNIIELWNRSAWTLRQTLTGHNAPVSTVAFSPDGRLLASGSDDKTIKLWDAVSGTLVKTLAGHEDRVMSVAFSRDGRLLASGSADNTIRFWDVASGAEKQTLRGHAAWVCSVAFSPDGRWLASGSHDRSVRIWDLASGREKQVLNGHKYDVESVAFSMTSRSIASGSRDRTVKLWGRTD